MRIVNHTRFHGRTQFSCSIVALGIITITTCSINIYASYLQQCKYEEVNVSKQIVTSIRVDEDIWKEAKKYAIDADISLAELVEKLLKEELERRKRR